MELCRTELKHKKKLDERETADIIKKTAVPALERANYIDNWIKNSGIGTDTVLNEYGANVNLKMLEVEGRVIPAPDIDYNATTKNRVMSRVIFEKGSWDHRSFKFRNPVPVRRWAVINHSRTNDRAVEQFVDEFIRIGTVHGMIIDDPLDMKNTYRTDDRRFKEMITNLISLHKTLDLILVVLDGTSNAYNVLKTACDLEYGVATQAVESRNVNKLSDQTISNILLKVNTKLNGRNFVISKEDLK
jgi:eukaryotic translation initiation factor 2C